MTPRPLPPSVYLTGQDKTTPPQTTHSIEPPEPLRRRPIPQLLRRHIPHIHLPLPSVPTLIVHHHPRAQQQSKYETGSAESGRGRQCRYILRRVLVLEDVGADDAHEVCEGDSDRGEEDAPAFMGDVVVIPLGLVSVSIQLGYDVRSLARTTSSSTDGAEVPL